MTSWDQRAVFFCCCSCCFYGLGLYRQAIDSPKEIDCPWYVDSTATARSASSCDANRPWATDPQTMISIILPYGASALNTVDSLNSAGTQCAGSTSMMTTRLGGLLPAFLVPCGGSGVIAIEEVEAVGPGPVELLLLGTAPLEKPT